MSQGLATQGTSMISMFTEANYSKSAHTQGGRRFQHLPKRVMRRKVGAAQSGQSGGGKAAERPIRTGSTNPFETRRHVLTPFRIIGIILGTHDLESLLGHSFSSKNSKNGKKMNKKKKRKKKGISHQ